MAKTVISPEVTLDFAYDNVFGVFAASDLAPTFSLEDGQEYIVAWDGEEHARTAFVFVAADDSECVGVGNPLAAGLEDNGDLFCIVYDKTHGYVHYLSLEQTSSHTVAVYKAGESDEDNSGTDTEEPASEGASIVLKDRNGEDVTYTGIKTVTFDTPDEGKQATFTLGVEMRGVEVELAMADGDQQIAVPEGYLAKTATIKKPDTLLPENIRNGVNVAGVIGNLVGDTEEATVELNLAAGDQMVLPSTEGKALARVTIKKPETLLPINIAKGVVIAGVTGTLSAEFYNGAITLI